MMVLKRKCALEGKICKTYVTFAFSKQDGWFEENKTFKLKSWSRLMPNLGQSLTPRKAKASVKNCG